MRIVIETRLCQSVVVAYPSPFKILDKLEEIYKKGQSIESKKSTSPAVSLEKTTVPKSFPYKINRKVLIIPMQTQKWILRLAVWEIVFWCPFVLAAEIVGSNMTDREFVKVAGKNKNGSAIPVKIPYSSSDSEESL